jgi:hypothetical protein
MKNTIDIDPKRKYDVTIEEVRSCPWFTHFSDEQAVEVIRTIKELTKIAYYEYRKERTKTKIMNLLRMKILVEP